ncbi:cytosine permease [Tessaracoccus sp. ZS01]|uniref:cytosine permease n=1 Tax=Tessaracoccus sp. ZS01 TaxID=1906324 RepID=UPI00096CE59A|nr:cytosine permease [Tessaracoccus sp. ZS01]MCG6566752.1 allantoin transporter [Tessaracoccus sp. ZS01]OMG57897.1 allantoin transporter [Tessaracoccus sp. ZS01]
MSTLSVDAADAVDISDETFAEYASRGYSEEVLPVRRKDRTWGIRNFAMVWMGPIHNILSYFTVVGFFAFGLSAWQVIGAIMTAAVIVSIGYVLNGHAAAKYGVPFAMLIRDTFGVKGAVFPALLRGLIAGCVFFGLTTVSSAQALDVVFERLFPGFLNLGGGADVLGLPIPTLISYVVMWVVTVVLYLAGQKFIGKFSDWASPAVWILMVVGVIIAISNAGGVGDVLALDPITEPVTVVGFVTCVSMLVSNWAGPIVNIADISRTAANQRAPRLGFPIGMIVSYILFAIVTVSFMASLYAVSGGEIDVNKPTVFVDAINSIGNPFIVILLILAMNVGATAFVVFGNMLPSGLQMTAQLPKWFTVKTGGLLAAVVGTLILPWQFVENTTMLYLFYSFIGSMFGPIAGIMLASYYLERKRVLNLDHIYTAPGADGGYPGGVNWRAIGVLVVSFVVTMSGKLFSGVELLATINNWAFFCGLIIGFVGYLLVRPRTTTN